jgi:hypothetical protein
VNTLRPVEWQEAPPDQEDAPAKPRRAPAVLLVAVLGLGLTAFGAGRWSADRADPAPAAAVVPVESEPPPVPPPAPPAPAGRTWHVSAAARSGGDGTSGAPFGLIPDALAAARPGDLVSVGPGIYPGFATAGPGRPDAPIVIKGTAAAVRGDGSEGRLVEILHDHVTLTGFDIAEGDIGVWIFGATGVRLTGNVIHELAGECVRVKYHAHDNEIVGNRIEGCGQDFDTDDGNKNGEGVYIGTSPEQIDRNPTPEPDASDGNWVHGNFIKTPAECVDIKEGASNNLVEGNLCRGGRDPDGAGFSVRGNANTVRDNVSEDHDGAGIRLGGDGTGDGVDNVVTGNRLSGNDGYAVKVQREPQRMVCGNEISGRQRRVTNGRSDPSSAC